MADFPFNYRVQAELVDANGTPIGSATPLEPPFQGVAALTVGAADATPRRAVGVVCTVAGNVVLKLADDSTYTIPVSVGLSILPFAVKGVVTSGTTATATYANLL